MGKKLLNEATVRKFMKLANIDRLTSNFVNETYSMEEEELKEGEHEEGMYAEGEHEEGMHTEMAHAEGEHEGDELDMDAEAEVEDTSEA